jgi:hypothetical protein
MVAQNLGGWTSVLGLSWSHCRRGKWYREVVKVPEGRTHLGWEPGRVKSILETY